MVGEGPKVPAMFVRNLIVLRSSLILSLGLTPGTIRCLMTGTEASMALCTCLIQALVAMSTCSGVSGAVVSGSMSLRCSSKVSQSAFEYCFLGGIDIWRGPVDNLSRKGRWSDDVSGRGRKAVLRYACLLAITTSGALVERWSILVGKGGPKC